MFAALLLDVVDERRELLEVAAHADELVVDQRLLAFEILAAEAPLGREHLLVHPHEVVDRGFDRLVALGGARLRRLSQQLLDRHRGHGRLAPRHDEGDDHRRDERGEHDQSEHHHQGFHRNAFSRVSHCRKGRVDRKPGV